MRYRNPIVAALLLAAVLQACVMPQAVIRLEPQTDRVRWDYGIAILEDQADSLRGRASFVGATREYLVFNLEVENLGNTAVLVSPEKFYLTNPAGIRFFAADPEKIILRQEVEASQQEANAKNTAIALGVVAAAAVTAAVIADINDGGLNDRRENRFAAAAPVVVDPGLWWFAPNLLYRDAAAAPPAPTWTNTQDRRFWTDLTLRRTTVDPGQRVRGQVLFSRRDDLKEFMLLAPVETTVLAFPYRQRVIQP